MTRTGLVMGTPGFIAPEIIDGAESDEMTDWWSVASVLAFAAIGAPVFGTKPMMAVLEREASGNANLTGLPAGTMAAFRSALNPDRSKRCTPDQLLNTIAVDALDPSVWQGTQAGPFAAGAIAGTAATIAADAVGTEAMPPLAQPPTRIAIIRGPSGVRTTTPRRQSTHRLRRRSATARQPKHSRQLPTLGAISRRMMKQHNS